MSTKSPGGRDHDENPYEAAINALIDGELDEAERAALKEAAAADPVLARAIVDAWRLHQGLDALSLERAPSRLTRRLRRIPREQRAAERAGGRPAWPRRLTVGALATAAVGAFAMMMMSSPQPPGGGPEAAELVRAEAARRDLAIAFHYLDKAGERAAAHLRGALHDAVAEPVTERISESMPYTEQSREEEHS